MAKAKRYYGILIRIYLISNDQLSRIKERLMDAAFLFKKGPRWLIAHKAMASIERKWKVGRWSKKKTSHVIGGYIDEVKNQTR